MDPKKSSKSQTEQQNELVGAEREAGPKNRAQNNINQQ